jgi:murein DD-endopeptidase MepM/ murein hydrolase activator NlpD
MNDGPKAEESDMARKKIAQRGSATSRASKRGIAGTPKTTVRKETPRGQRVDIKRVARLEMHATRKLADRVSTAREALRGRAATGQLRGRITTPRPPFQLPFRCGQTWRASTYDGHYPDQDSLDLLRFNGDTNISADEDVLASAAGTVVEAHDTHAEDPPYGSVVSIQHAGDWKTQYIHLDDKLLVKKGDTVHRGQRIAKVGGNIEIFGKQNAHLHYTQWKGDQGVRSMFDGVLTKVHAGAKDASGNYPTEFLTSANCPVPVAGIARGANWANSYWISTSLKAFQTTAQKLFDEKGRRLIWATTFVEAGKRRWAGIARAGTWASSFVVSTNQAQFEAKIQQLFDEHGRRLIHVHTYTHAGKRYWMGIASSGNWSNSYWISNSRAAFENRAQDLFDNKGRRLTLVETYVENGARRWIGIARGGTWANSFWISPSFASFNKTAQDLFDNKGRRLVHVHSYVSGGRRYWVGISRSGNWANSFWVSPDVGSFNAKAQDLFDNKGRRLMVAEYLDD